MSTAAEEQELIPGTQMTRAQLRAVSDELILRQRQAEATAYVRQRGRVQSPETRKRISAKVAAYRKRQALEAGDLHPLRRARLAANLTQIALAEKALIDPTTVQIIESGRGDRTSRLTLARLGRALNVAPDSLT